MKTKRRKSATGSVLANLVGRSLLVAVAFAIVGVGTAQATLVTIGDAGNTADTTSYGAVGYDYQISATEVTIAEFQQATGAGDGDENYWNDGTRTVGTAAPAVNVSLYEAMKYCNYRTSGNINNGYYSTSDGGVTWEANASSHDVYAAANGLTYFVPTEDEWYKAAYYTGNVGDLWSLYANGTDTVPTHGTTEGWNYYNNGYVNESPNYAWTVGYGGEEQNGTYDMMGNVWEWQEDAGGVFRGGNSSASAVTLSSEYRGTGLYPADGESIIGFRVVAVPEPASAVLLVLVSGLAWFVRRIKRA